MIHEVRPAYKSAHMPALIEIFFCVEDHKGPDRARVWRGKSVYLIDTKYQRIC